MIILNYQITKKSHKCTFRVSRTYRASGAVFKVRGPPLLKWGGVGGGGGNLGSSFLMAV